MRGQIVSVPQFNEKPNCFSAGEVDGAGESGGPRVHLQERRVGLRGPPLGAR